MCGGCFTYPSDLLRNTWAVQPDLPLNYEDTMAVSEILRTGTKEREREVLRLIEMKNFDAVRRLIAEPLTDRLLDWRCFPQRGCDW